mmetsp:Transcript_23428/g.34846  ORF Transcript_23428/g.34846 Transcript_23428/m.34846 type:complete len:237 (-) Transcript_23428:39-749(-)
MPNRAPLSLLSVPVPVLVLVLFCGILLLVQVGNVSSFALQQHPHRRTQGMRSTFTLPLQVVLLPHQRKRTSLAMDIGGFGKFFNLSNNGSDGNNDNNNDNEDDEDYPGCTNIFTIGAKSVKVGGCRLYLSLFFIGEANNPEKGAWRMNQNGDGGIDLYYKDATGALIVMFKEDAILVNRLGTSPSMDYLMQESSMLNGMLDQLDEIAMDSSINESDRLICIEGDEINTVRESLSFT